MLLINHFVISSFLFFSARGCLFNIRRDPTESHDLWTRASKIATLLTSRLRGLWAMQKRRGNLNLNIEADPANFDYVWTPWLSRSSRNTSRVDLSVRPLDGKRNENINFSFNFNQQRSGVRNTTVAAAVNCDGMTGLRNFLCVLKSVF